MKFHLLLCSVACGIAAVLVPELHGFILMLASIDLCSTALLNQPLIKPGPIAKLGHPWLCHD